MKLTIAKSAGYCFGVKRAVNMVYQEAEEAKVPVYTYGPIIHNEEVVRDLRTAWSSCGQGAQRTRESSKRKDYHPFTRYQPQRT